MHLKTAYAAVPAIGTRPNPSNPSLDPGTEDDTQINLLHMELFHHFQTELKDTLSFPQVWPLLLRQAFHVRRLQLHSTQSCGTAAINNDSQEPYIMCTILSLAATHLSILRPGTHRYSRAALRLLAKSAQLFRENLSRPITPENCDALMGTSILMHYLSWCNLSFLEDQRSGLRGLDLSQDQLFLLSPGVQHIFFEALPLFLSARSVFVSVALYRPRVRMEDAVRQRGRNPDELVSLFMRLWDDPHYRSEEADDEAADSSGIPEKSTYHCQEMVALYSSHPEVADMLRAREVIMGIDPSATPSLDPNTDATTTPRSASPSSQRPPFPRTPREAYERAARSLAVILCFPPPPLHGDATAAAPMQPDFERFFFSFPILLSGPFLGLARAGDARALVVLFHFYRAARVLLTSRESWWARERSHVLEGLILQELKGRGLGVCLR